jgi:phosphonate transport system permease protein
MTKNPLGTSIYYLTRSFFNAMRSIVPLILAIVFTVWVGLGPFAGVMALALHSVAALGKLYSEQIESIEPGPIEAIMATGASMLQVVRYAVVPQIVPPFIAFTIYRWDTNVRMSTVIGFVGGGGVGFILQQYINLLQYRQAATAVWAIAIVVAALDYLSAKVREKVV